MHRNGHRQTTDLHQLVANRFQRSTAVPAAYFEAEAGRIADACWEMARRFHQGGRLLAFGSGAWASDAQHVAVEFVHPVIVGKRALPALALTNDGLLIGGFRSAQRGGPFMRQLSILARSGDMAMGFSHNGQDGDVLAALRQAKKLGLLTLGFSSGDGGPMAVSGFDFCFTAPVEDGMVVQETHETLYHILWELVHIFFEHEGLLV